VRGPIYAKCGEINSATRINYEAYNNFPRDMGLAQQNGKDRRPHAGTHLSGLVNVRIVINDLVWCLAARDGQRRRNSRAQHEHSRAAAVRTPNV